MRLESEIVKCKRHHASNQAHQFLFSFASAKAQVDSELLALSDRLSASGHTSEKEVDLEFVEAVARTLKFSANVTASSETCFVENVLHMVEELEWLRNKSGSRRAKNLYTQLLFILSRCSRIISNAKHIDGGPDSKLQEAGTTCLSVASSNNASVEEGRQSDAVVRSLTEPTGPQPLRTNMSLKRRWVAFACPKQETDSPPNGASSLLTQRLADMLPFLWVDNLPFHDNFAETMDNAESESSPYVLTPERKDVYSRPGNQLSLVRGRLLKLKRNIMTTLKKTWRSRETSPVSSRTASFCSSAQLSSPSLPATPVSGKPITNKTIEDWTSIRDDGKTREDDSVRHVTKSPLSIVRAFSLEDTRTLDNCEFNSEGSPFRRSRLSVLGDERRRSCDGPRSSDYRKQASYVQVRCSICEDLWPSALLQDHSTLCAELHPLKNGECDAQLINLATHLDEKLGRKKTVKAPRMEMLLTRVVFWAKLASAMQVDENGISLRRCQILYQDIKDQLKSIDLNTHNLTYVTLLRYLVSLIAQKLDFLNDSTSDPSSHFDLKTSYPKFVQGMSIREYEIIKPISRGAFGRVYLARKIATREIFAIKVMRKRDLVRKNMVQSVTNERNILSVANNPFVVRFYHSFTSKDNLYIVMEYLSGGDCSSLIKALGSLEEQASKIYIAETILALEYCHAQGIIHRDLKPDNMLISSEGHIKLTDFGLSYICELETSYSVGRHVATPDNLFDNMSVSDNTPLRSLRAKPAGHDRSHIFKIYYDRDRNNKLIQEEMLEDVLDVGHLAINQTIPSQPLSPFAQAQNTGTCIRDGRICSSLDMQCKRAKGTPDYIAPELLLGLDHGHSADWWAVGVILYELIHGRTPFNAEEPELIFSNIIEGTLKWPSPISPECRDLIERLLCREPQKRLGHRGAKEIMSHPFFKDVVWEDLSRNVASFVPALKSKEDTSYFAGRKISRKSINGDVDTVTFWKMDGGEKHESLEGSDRDSFNSGKKWDANSGDKSSSSHYGAEGLSSPHTPRYPNSYSSLTIQNTLGAESSEDEPDLSPRVVMAFENFSCTNLTSLSEANREKLEHVNDRLLHHKGGKGPFGQGNLPMSRLAFTSNPDKCDEEVVMTAEEDQTGHISWCQISRKESWCTEISMLFRSKSEDALNDI